MNYELRMMNDELHLALRGEEECVVGFLGQNINTPGKAVRRFGRVDGAAFVADEWASIKEFGGGCYAPQRATTT